MPRTAESPAAPCLLAFDTSTELLAIAVHDGVRAHVVNAPGGAAASSQLLPRVHGLLGRCGLTLSQIEGIAFGCGPGAFTGLRTACAVAQGLALGLNLRVWPVDSLLIIAEDARAQADDPADFDVAVLMDARMNEIYAGRYRHAAGRWLATRRPQLVALDALPGLWGATTPQALAGSALSAFPTERWALEGATTWVSERDRATALLRLAQRAYTDGAGVDAADALPLYLRDKVAFTSAERAAAAGVDLRPAPHAARNP